MFVCLLSVSDEDQACEMIRTAVCESGFHLTKRMSNNRSVLSSIPEAERAKEVKELDLIHDVLPDERILGAERDVFAIYDPFGFLSAIMLPAKIILQQLW